MSNETDNHGYELPERGETDWHEPLNTNFERLDTAVSIRDEAANRDTYEPTAGATFIAVDTGVVSTGDGEEWQPAFSMAPTADGENATVSGGAENSAAGERATVAGGYQNVSSGRGSFAVGHRAHAVHDGAIVFGDATSSDMFSAGSNEVRSQMPIYAPSFNTTSASAAKTAVEPVSPESVLEKVTQLPISTWEFTEGESGRHLGPMAEEFSEQFGLGTSAESIASVDADGVALAAIQALASALSASEDEIAELKSRIADLESTVSASEETTRSEREIEDDQ